MSSVFRPFCVGLLLAASLVHDARAASSTPLPASQLPLKGEIALWGFVTGTDPATGAVTMKVISFALPNGRATRMAAAKEKLMQVDGGTSYLPEGTAAPKWEPGLAVYAVGRDLGKGQPLPARLVFTGPAFSSNSRWGGSANQSAPKDATLVAYTRPAPQPQFTPDLSPPNSNSSRFLIDRGQQASYVVRRFPLSNYSLQVSYVPYGHTAVHALNREAAAGAVYAFGGGYFQPGTKRTIDYLVVDGKPVDDYRWDWQRPVIAVKGGQVSIIRPDGEHHDPPGNFDWALAVDWKSTHRDGFVGRQIFGLTDTEMVFVRCYATEASARRTMANLGVQNYVFLDGGSSTPPSSRIPTRLVVVARPQAQLTASADVQPWK